MKEMKAPLYKIGDIVIVKSEKEGIDFIQQEIVGALMETESGEWRYTTFNGEMVYELEIVEVDPSKLALRIELTEDQLEKLANKIVNKLK